MNVGFLVLSVTVTKYNYKQAEQLPTVEHCGAQNNANVACCVSGGVLPGWFTIRHICFILSSTVLNSWQLLCLLVIGLCDHNKTWVQFPCSLIRTIFLYIYTTLVRESGVKIKANSQQQRIPIIQYYNCLSILAIIIWCKCVWKI